MKAIKHEAGMALLPPRPDVCQVCARDHRPDLPHDLGTLFYQVQFQGRFGRAPTWADAVAHCTPEMQAQWRAAIEARGAWTEPPAGQEPIDQPHRLGRRSEG